MNYEEFNEHYKPLTDSKVSTEHRVFGTAERAAHEASFLASDFNDVYRHVWTAVDIGGGYTVYINGFRYTNVMYYVVAEVPWELVDGKSTYLEVIED